MRWMDDIRVGQISSSDLMEGELKESTGEMNQENGWVDSDVDDIVEMMG